MPRLWVPGQLFNAPVDHVGGRRGPSRCRAFLGLILVGSLLALIPLAESSPADPLWMAGVYDGADYDDAVVALSSGLGLVDPGLLPTRELRFAIGSVRRDSAVRLPTAALSPSHVRAPPS